MKRSSLGFALLGLPAIVLLPGTADAGPTVIDVEAGTINGVERPLVEPDYPDTVAFDDLDEFIREVPAPPRNRHLTLERLPDGRASVGGMVLPEDHEETQDGGADGVTDDVRPGFAPRDMCAFPDETPAGVYQGDDLPGGEVPRLHTVFLNYNGGVLYAGMGENSAENYSSIARSGHPYPVYSGGESKAIAVAQAVAVDFQDWAIRVVYDPRPRKILPYTMVMIGGSYMDTTSSPAGGVAPLDCEDFGQRNVCYAFDGGTASGQAVTASQEVGHTMGLGHTDDCRSVMGTYGGGCGAERGFTDDCMPIITVADQSPSCTGLNLCHCGDRDYQHDKNTLSFTYAPSSTVDNTDPEIEILEPADGAEFSEDDDILIKLDVWDDYGGYGWKIVITDLEPDPDEEEVLVDWVDYDRETEFRLSGIPEGTYELFAEIMDQADHTATQTITFTVGEAEGGDDGDTGDGTGDSDDGAGDDGDTGDGTGDGDGGDDGGSGDADGGSDKGGCGCATSPAPASAALMLVGLFAGVRRRR